MTLTFQERVDLVRRAIERINLAKAERIDLEMDPASTGEQRSLAIERFNQCEREFSWQWNNVKAILDTIGAERHRE